MRLLIFGHSYVRDLCNCNLFNLVIENKNINIKYIYYPGAGYHKILRNPHLLIDPLHSFNPDIVITILGGNSVYSTTEYSIVTEQCREFYKILRNNSRNNCVVIAAQIEQRYFGRRGIVSALSEPYRKRRNKFNKFLNKLKSVDHILMVGGHGRLDHRVFYRDNTHLNNIGLRKYITYIKCTVAFAIRNSMAN